MTKTTVTITAYNPEWKNKFNTEKQQLISVLDNHIIGIEHIGSTSIKGLAAKPIIDILLGVQDVNNTSLFVHQLETIGYEFVPKPQWIDRKFFRKGEWGKGTVHLHLCEVNSQEWKEKLLFRDYLRSHLDIAKEYEDLKKELALTYKDDRHTYTAMKEPFIHHVIEKAMLERELQ